MPSGVGFQAKNSRVATKMINSWACVVIKLERLAETRGFKADLARRLGMSPSSLQHYFEGRRTPGIELVDRFAAALGIQPWELIRPEKWLPSDPVCMTVIEHLECVKLELTQQSIDGTGFQNRRI